MADLTDRLARLTPQQRELLARRMQSQAAPPARPPAIARQPRTAPLPLSFGQQRLWFLDQLEPGTPYYNCPLILRAHGQGAEGAPVLPDLPIQYADYAAWQRDQLQGAALARELDYWKHQLAGMPGVLDLPLDYPRPPTQTYRGDGEQIHLPPAVSG